MNQHIEENANTDLVLASNNLSPATSPAHVYLARFGRVSRRGLTDSLDTMASLVVPFAKAEDLPWHHLRYQHVAALRARLVEHYKAPSSINKALSALRGVLKEAFQLGLMSGEELARCTSVRNVRGVRLPKGRALTDTELSALFSTCTNGTTLDTRDAAMLALLLGTGLRRSEVVGLDIGDLETTTGTLRVRGKGDKERFVYVTNEARLYLDTWLTMRGSESGPLFLPVTKGGHAVARRLTDQSVYLVVDRRARLAGVKGFSPHDARRTFISNAIEVSRDLIAVKELAGHSNVNTTALYDRRGELAKAKVAGMVRLPRACAQ